MPEYQDLELSDNPEVPKYKDTEASDNPEVPVSGSKYGRKTHKTPEYFRTMDIYVKILIKMMRIHGRTSTRKLMHLILEGLKNFPRCFLINVKTILMSHTKFHLKPRIILRIFP